MRNDYWAKQRRSGSDFNYRPRPSFRLTGNDIVAVLELLVCLVLTVQGHVEAALIFGCLERSRRRFR